jgi:hypothetical protein
MNPRRAPMFLHALVATHYKVEANPNPNLNPHHYKFEAQ